MKDKKVIEYQDGVTSFAEVQKGTLLKVKGLKEYVISKSGGIFITGYKERGSWKNSLYVEYGDKCVLAKQGIEITNSTFISKLEEVFRK